MNNELKDVESEDAVIEDVELKAFTQQAEEDNSTIKNNFSEFFNKIKEKFVKIKEKFKKDEKSKVSDLKNALGLSVSYKLLIIDCFLLAFRMFNKTAAEAIIDINGLIWGNLNKLCDGIGDVLGNVPVVGHTLDSICDGIGNGIFGNIQTLLNIIPMVSYNFFEIMFWVFIGGTLLIIIPKIIAEYSVEKEYIQQKVLAKNETLVKRVAQEEEIAKLKKEFKQLEAKNKSLEKNNEFTTINKGETTKSDVKELEVFNETK